MSKQFTYHRGTDGCDETWDICYPNGTHLVSIHFWEQAERAEAEARLITNALNRYAKTISGAADMIRCKRLMRKGGAA